MVNLRMVPPNTEVFLHSLRQCGKIDLSMGYWNPERKLGVARHIFFLDKFSNTKQRMAFFEIEAYYL